MHPVETIMIYFMGIMGCSIFIIVIYIKYYNHSDFKNLFTWQQFQRGIIVFVCCFAISSVSYYSLFFDYQFFNIITVLVCLIVAFIMYWYNGDNFIGDPNKIVQNIILVLATALFLYIMLVALDYMLNLCFFENMVYCMDSDTQPNPERHKNAVIFSEIAKDLAYWSYINFNLYKTFSAVAKVPIFYQSFKLGFNYTPGTTTTKASGGAITGIVAVASANFAEGYVSQAYEYGKSKGNPLPRPAPNPPTDRPVQPAGLFEARTS